MKSSLILLIFVLPAYAGVVNNQVDDTSVPDAEERGGQAGEVDLGIKGQASFSKIGAVAIPAGYEPVIVDVRWADVFEVVDVVKHHLHEVLNHTRVATEDKTRLVEREMQCLKNAEGKVADIKALVQHKERRDRRGFLELIGNLIGLGLGMSNRHLVHEIAARQGTLHHTQVEQREVLQKTREETAEALRKLDQGHEMLLARQVVSELCQEMGQYLDRMTEAVYLALEAKVSSSLLKPKDLMRLARRVEASMKAQQLRTLETGASMILRANQDVVLTDQMMRVLFLVPVVNKREHVKELWRLNPVELQSEGRIHRVQASHEFLAVGGGGLVPITAAQLMACKVVYDIHVCLEGRIEERVAMSCVSAIYTADRPAMERLCVFQQLELGQREHAVALGSNRFYLRAEKPLREQCGDNRRVKELRGDRASLVGEQCQVAGAGFEILKLPRPSSLQSYKPHVSFTEQQGADHAIESVKSLVNDQLAELEASIPEVHPLAQLKDNTWIWIIVGLGVGALLLGLCGGFILRGASKAWALLSGSNAAARRQEEASRDENFVQENQYECKPAIDGLVKEECLGTGADIVKTVLTEVVTSGGKPHASAPPPRGRLGVVEEGEDVAARVLPGIVAAFV